MMRLSSLSWLRNGQRSKWPLLTAALDRPVSRSSYGHPDSAPMRPVMVRPTGHPDGIPMDLGRHVADLMLPRLIGDGHPPGSAGVSVRLALWAVALVLAAVACAPPTQGRVGQSAVPSLSGGPCRRK